MIHIKTTEEIETMREGGKILASVLHELVSKVKPGLKLAELDELGEKLIKEAGATPSFKGYQASGMAEPYPNGICLSINDEIVHGLPKDRILQEGQVLTIDAGVYFKGFHTDSAITVGIGEISKENQKLIDVTRESLNIAINMVKPGVRLGDIGHAIEKCVKENKFSVIDGLVGHGVGRELQEEPIVPNFGKPGTLETLKEGMVLAIEPMVTLGKKNIILAKDGFAYKTANGSISAHFEHTVAVMADGNIILTQI
jgi:methionyl aminopeptidase